MSVTAAENSSAGIVPGQGSTSVLNATVKDNGHATSVMEAEQSLSYVQNVMALENSKRKDVNLLTIFLFGDYYLPINFPCNPKVALCLYNLIYTHRALDSFVKTCSCFF